MRAKDYSKYLKSNLYNYELPDDFYCEIFEDQLNNYNRYEFKQTIAHVINFKSNISDNIIEAICKVC
jgi:hypothetical protein